MRRYAIEFNSKETAQITTECLVIGSGVAGLMTAWKAAQQGIAVTLAVKDSLLDSNTNKAQGGIAVAMGRDDNPELHLQDTLIAGAGLCDEAVVKMVVEDGPAAVQEIIAAGAIFDRDEKGELCFGREGCHCRSRVIHAQGDATGAEVVRSLLAAVKNTPNIKYLENYYAVDLLVTDGVCKGVLFFDEQGSRKIIRAGAVVLATGGLGRLFCHTTNPEGATGNGVAMAYRAGAEVMDMEFVQFHPTALAITGAPNFLISEAVRGDGGILRNSKGERFMPAYHKMAELAPRDVVARAIFNEMRQADSDSVFLDVSSIDVAKHFPMITATCLEYGLDIKKELIPVAPAAHYMMGGVHVNLDGETNIKNLFCCGEVSCTGLQGANRLASNSLLEGLVYGRRIAAAVAKRSNAADETAQWSYCDSELKPAEFSPKEAGKGMQKIMTMHLGLIREQDRLHDAEAFFDEQEAELDKLAFKDRADIDYLNMVQTASLIAMSAGMREESRGGHFRSDYAESRSYWRRHIILKK